MIHMRQKTGLAVAVLLAATLLFPVGTTQAAELELQSSSAILMDALSGKILYEKNSHQRLAPASVTKIMTLTLVLEALEEGKVGLQDPVQASAEAVRWGGTQIWLEEGEVFPLDKLMLAVAVGSANDASVALAEHVAGSHKKFAELMNAKARELGMQDTQFQNAHGLPAEGHYTSAYDMALLSRYLLRNYPQVLDYTRVWIDHLRGTETELVNTNKLIKRFKGVDGLKTGYTNEAGHCLVATVQQGDTRLISVIMKAASSEIRFRESASLLRYGFANWETVPVAQRGTVLGDIPVEEGVARRLDATVAEDFGVTVPRGRGDELSREVKLVRSVVAPVAKGQEVGEVIVTLAGEIAGRTPLVAAVPVARSSIFQLVVRYLTETWPAVRPGW